MKRSALLIGLVAMLAMPGIVAVPAHAADGAPTKADKGGGKKNPGISGGKFSGDPIYVHLQPLVLPIINASGAEQIVTLIVTIQVKDFDTADTIQSHMPVVRDALMRALYGGLGDGDLRDGYMVDVAKVKAKATAAIDSVIGAAGIRDVLIEDVGQRML